MKQRLRFVLLATAALLAISPLATRACVNYHPTAYTTAVVDSDLHFMEIVVHNLQLFGGTNGEFCTCSITAYDDYYDQIYYVAFLDSATGLPEPGFAPWGSNSLSAASWAAANPGFNWHAYVAAVTTSGLLAGKAVNLVIRASLPVGFTFSNLDSLLYGSLLGTDAYDSTNHTIANMHNSVTGIGFTGDVAVTDAAYFTGMPQTPGAGVTVNVFPNPASDMATFMWTVGEATRKTLILYNAVGALVRRVDFTDNAYRLFRNGLPAGVYSYRVESSGGVERGRLIFR